MRTGSPGAKPTSDATLPENSKENLDRKLDHATEETFPTSDPVSVTVTKGGGIDYDQDRKNSRALGPQNRSGNEGSSKGDDLVRQVIDAVHGVTDAAQGVVEAASGVAREISTEGKRYGRQAREQYPEADRYYRQGSQMIRKQVVENPILTLLLGLTVGYVLGWAIHGRYSGRRERMPGRSNGTPR